MNDEVPGDPPENQAPLTRAVEKRVRRHLKAKRQRQRSLWFGLGMFGLVGWSVAVPTLLGIALGWWLDHTFPGTPSWTLTFLFLGVALGCYHAWQWVKRESRHDG